MSIVFSKETIYFLFVFIYFFFPFPIDNPSLQSRSAFVSPMSKSLWEMSIDKFIGISYMKQLAQTQILALRVGTKQLKLYSRRSF